MTVPAVPQPALVAVFQKHLLPEFGRRGRHDPWWWPANDGCHPADWGLSSDLHDPSFASLRGREAVLDGFPGSLCANGSNVAVYVGSRPSMSAYPNGSDSRRRYRFLCAALGQSNLDQGRVHVTDLVKYRWSKDDNCGLDYEMWCRSLRCLQDEFACVQVGPVLVAKAALGWLHDIKDTGGVLVDGPSSGRRVRARLPDDLLRFCAHLCERAGPGVPSMYATRSTKGGARVVIAEWRARLQDWPFRPEEPALDTLVD